MKHLIRLTDWSKEEVQKLFNRVDLLEKGVECPSLLGRTIVLFFPSGSIRTRIAFESGITRAGGHVILFDPTVLDKKEDLKDVAGYLNHFADAVIIRHPDIQKLEYFSSFASIPVVNAMTDVNHPCEILSDLYALGKRGRNIELERYLFMGSAGNIGYAWKEARDAFGLDLIQSCPREYRMEGIPWEEDLKFAIKDRTIVCTDSVPADKLTDFQDYQITTQLMESASSGSVLNPCPPFYRGEEVSHEVMESDFFVGYEFKRYLQNIQLGILLECMVENYVTQRDKR